MKKHILILLVTLLGVFTTNAQNKKKDYEKIRAFKVTFIAEKLDLTESESEKFWPIYNVYDKKMLTLHKAERHDIKKKILGYGGIDSLSQEEAKKVFEKIKQVTKDKYETKTSFYNKLSTFLPEKKILRLEVAEYEFHKKLIQKLKGKKNKHK